MKKAVLLITFNRLEPTKKVFEQIRIAKPPRLYLASDGPRQKVDGEAEIVNNVRDYLLKHIDWDCEVKTRFLDTNSGGCKYGVANAVSWFFENEQDGIILEDDCVPNQSFFIFCEELLDKYKNNKRIWHIAGDAPYEDLDTIETYYFAKVQHCWGWATWADRWKYFKFEINDYDENNIKKFSKRKEVQKYWLNILNQMKKNKIDSWAYLWAFWIISNDGYCINPYKNLINNIGDFGVHYNSGNDPRLNRKTYSIDKIIHPKKVEYNYKVIDFIYKFAYGIHKESNPIFYKIKSEDKRTIVLLNTIKISYKK